MKVKVIYDIPSYHPRFGYLKPGDVLEVPDDYPIKGSSLFEKVKEEKKKPAKPAKEKKHPQGGIINECNNRKGSYCCVKEG